MTSGSQKRSVLLVDDVELFLELERTFFHRDDFDLLMAVNTQEIMQLVLKKKPDLVFMDMDVAGSRGDEICRWIKRDEQLQSIPVIMVIDAGDNESESLCRLAGCDAIIHRPVKRHQLLSAARTYLDLVDRRLSRVPTQVPVQFSRQRGDVKTNYSVNLSPGGVFLATDDILPVDTLLALRLNFPEKSKSITCRGRVAWLNQPGTESKKPHLPTGMGIQFSQLKNDQLNIVKGFLSAAS